MVAAATGHEQVSNPFQVGSGVLGEAHDGIPKGNDPTMALFFSPAHPKGPGDEGDSAGMRGC